MVITIDNDTCKSLIIDAHAHMGYFGAFNIYNPDTQSVLERMDKLGIDVACFSHHLGLGGDFVTGNTIAEQMCRDNPDRLKFYMAINPNYPELINNQIVEYNKSHHAIGFKIHPSFHEMPMDHPNLLPVYEAASCDKGIVLIHVWGIDAVNSIDKLAGRFPETNFIAGHGGGDFPAMKLLMEIIKHHPNLYADTAVSKPWQGNIEWMVSRVGYDRLLFGSDMPFYDPGHTFGRILLSSLGVKAKKNIMGQNMEKLLNMRIAS